MKKLLPIMLIALLSGCGAKDEKKAENTKEAENENPETQVEKVIDVNAPTCFKYESFCEGESGKKLKCELQLSILNDTVTANSFCSGCKGNVETFYKGVKHEDTLILDEIITNSDGNETRNKTFWIISGDQLNQLVTTKRNGKVILKEQATHTFLSSYEKINCN